MLTTLAVSAAGALMQNNAQNRAIEAQQTAQNRNIEEGYRVAQERQRQAELKAFEQRTDRAQQANRQLAMARVGAAEGAGSLAASAMNISAAAAADLGRIDAGLDNERSGVSDQMAALQAGGADAAAQAAAAGRVSQVQAGAQIGQALVGAGAQYFQRQTQLDVAKNYRIQNPPK
ncbi:MULTISPECIES: hypothetical protein [Cupriavidus]|nr:MULTISPECIES: hypothetical protein [Cupriavidus]